MKFVSALRLGRVSNLPTVWTNVLSGLALAGQHAAPISRFLWTALAMSLLYVGGMYLNDAFDAEVDARERPERPIPAGDVTRGTVFVLGGLMLAGGVLLALYGGLLAGIAALLTALVIVLYDAVHKQTALAPALMALCRVGVYASAGLLVSAPRYEHLALGAAMLFAYVLGLTYAAARENSSALVRTGPLLGLAAPLVARALLGVHSLLELLVLVAFALWVVRCVRLVRARVPHAIKRGVGGLIAGIALIDALWLSASNVSACLWALAAFALTLLLQRYVAGT